MKMICRCGNSIFGPFLNWNDQLRRSPIATAFTVSLALFTDMLAYGIVVPILPNILATMKRGDSTSHEDLGILVAAYAVGLLIFTPLFGIFSDRYRSRKAPMLCGLVGLCVATVLFTRASNFTELCLARIAQGISGGAAWSIGLSMLADVYPSDSLDTVMGAVMGANVIGQLLGPPLGGYLYQHISPQAPFYFCAFLAAVDFLARLWVIPPVLKEKQQELVKPGDEVGKSKPPVYSIREMLTDPPLIICNLATIAIANLYSGLEPTLTIFFQSEFGADETAVGLLFTAIVIPNIFVSMYAGHFSEKFGRKYASAIGMIILSFVSPLVAIPSGKSWISWTAEVVMLMVFGSATALAITPIMPDIAETVAKKGGNSYGQVYALFNMAYSLGMITGPLMATVLYGYGFLLDSVYLSVAVAIAGCLMAFYARKTGERVISLPQHLHQTKHRPY